MIPKMNLRYQVEVEDDEHDDDDDTIEKTNKFKNDKDQIRSS